MATVTAGVFRNGILARFMPGLSLGEFPANAAFWSIFHDADKCIEGQPAGTMKFIGMSNHKTTYDLWNLTV